MNPELKIWMLECSLSGMKSTMINKKSGPQLRYSYSVTTSDLKKIYIISIIQLQKQRIGKKQIKIIIERLFR